MFERRYVPCDLPQRRGRPPEVSLTKGSGLPGLISIIEQQIDVEREKAAPRLLRLQDHVLGEFDAVRQTALEREELRLLVEAWLAEPAEALAAS